jgi:hypothetical protein
MVRLTSLGCRADNCKQADHKHDARGDWALTLRCTGRQSWCSFQRHQPVRVLPALFQSLAPYPGRVEHLPRYYPGWCPIPGDEGSHSLPDGTPLPLWYHPQPATTDFEDPRTRRMARIRHAAIDGESFVVDQPREVLE